MYMATNQMTFAQNARALRNEYESKVGVLPPYPRSRNAYNTLAATLKHYEFGISPINEAVKEQMLQDEFARLRGIDDIVIPTKQTFGQRAKALRDKYTIPVRNVISQRPHSELTCDLTM